MWVWYCLPPAESRVPHLDYRILRVLDLRPWTGLQGDLELALENDGLHCGEFVVGERWLGCMAPFVADTYLGWLPNVSPQCYSASESSPNPCTPWGISLVWLMAGI